MILPLSFFVTQKYNESWRTIIPVVAYAFIIVSFAVLFKNKARVETQAAPKLTAYEKDKFGFRKSPKEGIYYLWQ
jgi:hypothetical protein